MTPAEQALYDAALAVGSKYDEDGLTALEEARRVVQMERMPEGFEQNLRQLAEREEEARSAAYEYSKKHTLGHSMLMEMRKAYRANGR